MFFKPLICGFIRIATVLLVVIPIGQTSALTKDKVKEIAFQTTVLIDQGLQKGDVEQRQEFKPGSGVIVFHSENTYYVLTALHVVSTRGVIYGIRTSDGEVHLVNDFNTQSNIYPFGIEPVLPEDGVIGFDLAIVKFTSKRTYPIALVANSETLKIGDKVFVAGWSEPATKTHLWKYRLSQGSLTQIVNPPSLDGGYSLMYTNQTHKGMSGGPIFNTNGELIGIHGRGRGRKNNCSSSKVNISDRCGIHLLTFRII